MVSLQKRRAQVSNINGFIHSKCFEKIGLEEIIRRTNLNQINNHTCKKIKKVINKICSTDQELRELSEELRIIIQFSYMIKQLQMMKKKILYTTKSSTLYKRTITKMI